jgi:hypothetical protein
MHMAFIISCKRNHCSNSSITSWELCYIVFLNLHTTTNQSTLESQLKYHVDVHDYTTCKCNYKIEMHIKCQKWVLCPNNVVVHVQKVVENIVPIPCLLIPICNLIFKSLSQFLTTTTKKLQIKALQVWTTCNDFEQNNK